MKGVIMLTLSKVILVSILGLLLYTPISWAGKLEKVRQAIHGSDQTESDHDDDDDDDDFSYDPFCMPYDTFCKEDYPVYQKKIENYDELPPAVERSLTYFLARPYALDYPGHVFRIDQAEVTDPSYLQKTSIRLASEYALDLEGVHRPSYLLSYDQVSRFGFSSQWTHYIEQLGDQQYDQLTIGDLNLTIRLIQNQKLQLRYSMGIRMLLDSPLSVGVSVGCLADFFIKDPFVISFVGDIGILGLAFYLHTRLTAGALWGHLEGYLGYDLVYIDGKSASAMFQGPLIGIRLWI
jgi:hypothetical protein